MEVRKFTALEIANLIIVYANNITDRKVNLTPIKLQKILYYVYVDCLVNHNIKLFDTPIEKWKFGPVVSLVYYNFKPYGVSHIDEPRPEYVFTEGEIFSFNEIPFNEDKLNLTTALKNAIKSKVDELIDIDPFELVERTHREKPWKKYETKIIKGERGLMYSDQEIIEEFSS